MVHVVVRARGTWAAWRHGGGLLLPTVRLCLAWENAQTETHKTNKKKRSDIESERSALLVVRAGAASLPHAHVIKQLIRVCMCSDVIAVLQAVCEARCVEGHRWRNCDAVVHACSDNHGELPSNEFHSSGKDS